MHFKPTRHAAPDGSPLPLGESLHRHRDAGRRRHGLVLEMNAEQRMQVPVAQRSFTISRLRAVPNIVPAAPKAVESLHMPKRSESHMSHGFYLFSGNHHNYTLISFPQEDVITLTEPK